MTAAPVSMTELMDDLRAEEVRLESLLFELNASAWVASSAAPGWSVADVVLHLAQSEEAVAATFAAGPGGPGLVRPGGATLDQAMDALVCAQRDEGPAVFERWRLARRSALAALESADPATAVTWAATPLRPRTLATTRLAEHWAHGLDIAGPLGIAFEDSPRLRHIVWLAQRSLPYALSLAGLEPQPVRCVLTGPQGEQWAYGPSDAPTTIRGQAGEFCRVAVRRLAPEQTQLRAEGPQAAAALAHLRTYAA
jgi:uncharacterized protein (TIGR03084 family)